MPENYGAKPEKEDHESVKIETNEELGRHLVATRDIKEGEIIMRMNPLLLAPKTVSFPLCLTCHKRLNAEGDFYKCSKCEWPLCDLSCENSDLHVEECKILAKSSFRPDVSNDNTKQSCYSIIGPLRALLLKPNCPEKFNALMNLQSNLDLGKTASSYNILKRSLVQFLKATLKMDATEIEVQTILSIFDTNCFDVRDSSKLVQVRGLYPMASMMSHDCKQNTKHTFDTETLSIVVSATLPIAKGEIITTTYTQSLWGTLARLAHLKQAKQFECTCKRCSDPTELGTYVGSMYCSDCKELSQEGPWPKIISTDPLDAKAEWKCEKCEYFVDVDEIEWMNEGLKYELRQVDKTDPEGFEDFLVKYKDILHSSNCHVLEAKYALSQIYGNVEGFLLTEMSDELISRKIELCRELLEVAESLEPGLSRFRGLLLYDLQAAIEVQTKREHQNQRITMEAANDILKDVIKILQESVEILGSEPDIKDVVHLRLKNVLQIMNLDM